MSEATRRTRAGGELRDRLGARQIELQTCLDCGHVQYPPAEVCRHCLGGELPFRPFDPHGSIVACALVHRSYREDFADGGPWPVGSVRLDGGATVFAHVAGAIDGGTRVSLVALSDRLGEGVFGAVREPEEIRTIEARFKPGS